MGWMAPMANSVTYDPWSENILTLAYLASVAVKLMELEATLAEILVKWAPPVLVANSVMDLLGMPDRPELMAPLVSHGWSDAPDSSDSMVCSDSVRWTGSREPSGWPVPMDSMES